MIKTKKAKTVTEPALILFLKFWKVVKYKPKANHIFNNKCWWGHTSTIDPTEIFVNIKVYMTLFVPTTDSTYLADQPTKLKYLA